MYENAKNAFDTFIKENYDLENEKILHKLNHTYNVVNNAEYIAEDMGLNAEDKELAMLIALLHDIGRFDQAIKTQSFREDITNYDHATLGVKILFDDGLIRNFVETNKYDEIIKQAIGNHSKYILDSTILNSEELLYCKIIRDADKIDSFRAKSIDDIYTMANITCNDIELTKISDKVFADFMNEKTILSKDRKTGIDIWISYIVFVFGLEFNSSLRKIKEKDYINILFNRFEYKNDRNRMEILRNKALRFINKKLDNG